MLRSKLFIVLTMVLFFGIAIAGLVQAQEVKKIKLPNGEEVVDISGEWDSLIENYGPNSEWGNYENVTKITMKGNSFVGMNTTSELVVSRPPRRGSHTSCQLPFDLVTGQAPPGAYPFFLGF